MGTHICVTRTSSNRVIAACDLYCCLLPQCEALRACCSGSPHRNSIVSPRNNYPKKGYRRAQKRNFLLPLMKKNDQIAGSRFSVSRGVTLE